MATYYVDYEGGNDANNGLTFATRKKTIVSATTAATNNVPNEIRVMASPEPTLIGDGYITTRPAHENRLTIGTITFSTTPGETVITLTSHNFSTGDTIGIFANGNGRYINGTWEITVVDANTIKLNGYTANANTTGTGGYVFNLTQKRILLDSAVTQNIACYGPRTLPWTSSSNVTTAIEEVTNVTLNASTMEHSHGDKFTISAAFTTGKAAFYTLPSTLDLSGYQQISLFFRIDAGLTQTNPPYTNFSLRLCTDTNGDTSVHTVNIPVVGGVNNTYPFRPITVDFGTNLNSNIRSVALYIDTDLGAQTIYLSNIIACKSSSSPDSLTLNSLIGLNITTSDSGGRPSNKEWYAIESINGRRVLLQVGNPKFPSLSNTTSSGNAVWFGDNVGTKSIYKREPIKYDVPESSINTTAATSKIPIYINSSGGFLAGDCIITGGWNRTDMSTKTGMTYYDLQNSVTYGMYASARSYITISDIGVIRAHTGAYFSTSTSIKMENVDVISCPNGGFYIQGGSVSGFKNIKIICCPSTTSGYQNSNANLVDYDGSLTIVGCLNRGMYHGGGSSCTILRSFDIRHGHVSFAAIPVDNGSFYAKYVDIYPGDSSTSGTTGISVGSIRSFRGPRSEYDESKLLSGSPNQLFEQTKAPSTYVGIATVYAPYGFRVNDNGMFVCDEFNYRMFGPNPIDWNYKTYGTSITTKKTGRVAAGGVGVIKKGGIGRQFEIYVDGQLFLNNFNIEDTVEFTDDTTDFHGMFCSKNHDGVGGEIYNVVGANYIVPDTNIRHTDSGFSWKITGRTVSFNTVFNIARVPATANSPITFKLWFYRSTTDSPLAGLVVYNDGNIDGLTDNVTATTTSTLGWQEVSLTVTPQNNCIVNVHVFVNANTTTGKTIYIDDFSIS